MIKINPRRLPKFHQTLKLTGEGKSTRVLLRILRRGSVVRVRVYVTCILLNEYFYSDVISNVGYVLVYLNIFLKKIKTC